MSYTDGIPSPEIFRLWSGISALAATLERRVWINTARSILFPHLYILLVSPPGIGKSQAIDPVGDLWHQVKELKTAPDNLTKAAMMDALGQSLRVVHPAGKTVEFHSMAVNASELGVFLSTHDLEFLSVINRIYDSPRRYREERRHSLKEPLDISYPQLNILAGTQPGFLSALLPEEAWTMGFCSRIIMIYSGVSPEVALFNSIGDESPAVTESAEFKSLLPPLNHIAQLYGPFHWDPEAKHAMTAFNKSRKTTDPDHTKLTHYNSRRVLHALKLTMIAAISARQELSIQLCDVERALDWLLTAEAVMPDIFREMNRRSDNDVLGELHRFLWQLWAKEQRPIHEARMYNFLKVHLPSDKIGRLIEIALRANIIQRAAGTENMYIPRPTHEHGME